MSNIYTNLLSQAEKLFRHSRQNSYKTRERYREAFERFLRYLADEYRLQKLANISGRHLSEYIDNMQERGLSASTVKTDLAAIRFWHDQIPNARYNLPPNDEFELERRKFGVTDWKWSSAEFNKMLVRCFESNREDYEACIIIARYAGLRLHEVMRIDTAAARAALKNDYLTVKGKNGLIRSVPINYTIRTEFEKFLKIVPPGRKFFVPDGKDTHIAMKELQNFIAGHRKTVQDSDSARPMTFHGLRHNFAYESYQKLISDGKSNYEAEKQISLWMGHKRTEITRIYLHD
jgi:site-specific recombinase XerD